MRPGHADPWSWSVRRSGVLRKHTRAVLLAGKQRRPLLSPLQSVSHGGLGMRLPRELVLPPLPWAPGQCLCRGLLHAVRPVHQGVLHDSRLRHLHGWFHHARDAPFGEVLLRERILSALQPVVLGRRGGQELHRVESRHADRFFSPGRDAGVRRHRLLDWRRDSRHHRSSPFDRDGSLRSDDVDHQAIDNRCWPGGGIRRSASNTPRFFTTSRGDGGSSFDVRGRRTLSSFPLSPPPFMSDGRKLDQGTEQRK